MPRFSLLLLLLVAPLTLAEEYREELAYSLGVRLGERLREEVPELELRALLRGLRDAYEDQPLRLDAARIDELLEAHEASLASAAAREARAAKAEQRFMAREKAKPGVKVLSDNVLLQELRAGHGPTPTANGRVQVRYVGYLADGSQFDESQMPQWFRLDSVIAGWRTALAQMPVGARWRLVIPSSQAYGAEGAGDLIPPYSPLIFEVELIAIGD